MSDDGVIPDDGLIPAVVVVAPDREDERAVPVRDRLFVGRECAGVDDGHRLLIHDPTISRTHLEVRLDFERDQAWLTDHSTNGTRLNGRRIERFVPVRIRSGDRVLLGKTELEFRSPRFVGSDNRKPVSLDGMTTIHQAIVTEMVMVVGDVISFSTIAENTDDQVLLANIERLFARLLGILDRHHGTLANYAGDAFFATWEAGSGEGVTSKGARAAVAFALEAAATVPLVAATLELRDPEGGPVRMGWGVSSGPAAVSGRNGPLVTVLGDATNVAFRLSGIAGRDGSPEVLVTGDVHRKIETGFAFTPLPAVQVKGRRKLVEVLGVGLLSFGGTTPLPGAYPHSCESRLVSCSASQ
jgi:adenylate cyclase